MTYNPTPAALERDATMLQRILARALRRLDERDPPTTDHRLEETFIGHCYQPTGEQRRAAT